MSNPVKRRANEGPPPATTLIRLNAWVNGTACGVVCGAGLMAMTLWLVIKGGDPAGPHLALLGNYFIGYTVSVGGAFIGLVYGFAAGFFAAFFVSVLYNRISQARSRR